MPKNHNSEIETPPVYVFPSALGWLAVQWEHGQLRALVFGWASGEEAAVALQNATRMPFTHSHDIGQHPNAADHEIRRFAERIQAYAEGRRDDFRDVPVALDEVTGFRRQVLRQCRRIPYGQTLTYGELAAKSGSPGAARAVGGVMAGNRVPLVIPCHRVVGASRTLVGYSGAGGVATKRRLLELEGAWQQ